MGVRSEADVWREQEKAAMIDLAAKLRVLAEMLHDVGQVDTCRRAAVLLDRYGRQP